MQGNNFDEAHLATQEMFEQEMPIDENLEEDVHNDEQVDENPQDMNVPEQDEQLIQTADEAVQAAELGAQAAQQKDNELQQVLQELNVLRGTIEQMSHQQEESIVNEMTQPQLPMLDIDGMAFDDEDTRQTKQQEYVSAMTEYVKSQMMAEFSPFIEQAKEGQLQKERATLMESLKDVPELQGIEQMLPQLEKIIANDAVLSSDSVPLDEKYIKAYVMAKGVDTINNPRTEPSVDDLMNYYQSNNDFRDMVERMRVEELQKGQQVPPMSSSNGAVNAALNIKEKPTTFEEASERTRKMFGFN